MYTDYSDIAKALRDGRRTGRITICRGEEERAFLKEFVSSPGMAGERPEQGATAGRPGRADGASCGKCGNVRDRKKPAGNGENGVMIILNPPSMVSGMERRKYREEATDLMKKMMAAIDIDIRKCYITSLIKCDPAEPTMSPGGMFRNCEPILEQEIACLAPRVVIVMGDMRPLKRVRDRHTAVSWFAVDHPIALINNPDLKRGAWNTLKLARESID
ncbi:MAG TPA: uracil-DNA glycosylase family protein [Spirochaetota bacterium]|nr:uracil-DNA glycosylase family protein [Spirochaetota bacterium]